MCQRISNSKGNHDDEPRIGFPDCCFSMSAVRYRSKSAIDELENVLSLSLSPSLSLLEQKYRNGYHDEIESSSLSSWSKAFATRKACLFVAEPFFSGFQRALPDIPRPVANPRPE
jgi:hypothetical protein